MAVNTESTATFASLGAIFNLVATSLLVFDNFPNQILPSIWFGLNSVSFGLCAYIFQGDQNNPIKPANPIEVTKFFCSSKD